MRKMLEVPLAYLVSALWRKKVVMETYLNIATWGPVVGAEKANQHYFHKMMANYDEAYSPYSLGPVIVAGVILGIVVLVERGCALL